MSATKDSFDSPKTGSQDAFEACPSAEDLTNTAEGEGAALSDEQLEEVAGGVTVYYVNQETGEAARQSRR